MRTTKLKLFLTGLLAVAGLATSGTSAYAATVGQSNAVRSAQEYLASQAFSQKGLIGQLKYEGFTTSQANYAVHHISVNW